MLGLEERVQKLRAERGGLRQRLEELERARRRKDGADAGGPVHGQIAGSGGGGTGAGRARRNPEIAPAHLLVALLEQEDGLVVPILQKLGADTAAIAARRHEAVERCRS